MGRRYLTGGEVEGALRRGKTVECFLGRFLREGVPALAYCSLGLRQGIIELSFFEVADAGNTDWVDLYEFEPLDAAGELGQPTEVTQFIALEDCLTAMDARWPGSASRLVNQGVVQDEYHDDLVRSAR